MNVMLRQACPSVRARVTRRLARGCCCNVRGRNMAVIGCISTATTVSCLPGSFSNDGVQVATLPVLPSTADSPRTISVELRRLLRKLSRALRLLLRALLLMSVWSPMAASGAAICVSTRLPLIPETLIAQLSDAWWRTLLKVIEFSGPSFIKAAQWASTRRDSFPEDVCNRLVSRLRHDGGSSGIRRYTCVQHLGVKTRTNTLILTLLTTTVLLSVVLFFSAVVDGSWMCCRVQIGKASHVHEMEATAVRRGRSAGGVWSIVAEVVDSGG